MSVPAIITRGTQTEMPNRVPIHFDAASAWSPIVRAAFLFVLAVSASPTTGAPKTGTLDLYGDPLPDGAVMRLGTVRHRLPGATFEFAPDGKSIVAVSWGRYVYRLDAMTGLVTEKFTLPVEDALQAHMFPDGQRAIVVRRPRPHDWQDSWEIWDLHRKARITTVRKGPEWMWSPSFSLRGDHFAAAWVKNVGADQELACGLFDSRTGQATDTFLLSKSSNESQCILSPVFSSDGTRMLYGLWKKGVYQLRCLEVSGEGERWGRAIPSDSPGTPVQMPEGRYLQSVGGRWQTLDARSGETREVTGLPATAWSPVAFAGEVGLAWVSADSNPRLHVWDWKTDRSRSGPSGWDIGAAAGGSLVPAPDGKSVLIAGSTLAMVDVETGKLLWGDGAISGHAQTVNQLRFSADGARLASAADDGTVRAWDVRTGRQLGRWEARANSTGAPNWTSDNSWCFGASSLLPMDLSPDGRFLVLIRNTAAKGPCEVEVLDVGTGRTVASHAVPLEPMAGGDSELPGSVGFSADGCEVIATYGLNSSDALMRLSHTTARWHYRSDRWTALGHGDPAPVERTAVGRSRAIRFTYGKGFSTKTGQGTIDLVGGGLGPMTLTSDDRLVAGVGRKPDNRELISLQGSIRDLRVWDGYTGHVIATL